MLGAIIGDIVGSRFEFTSPRIKTTEFVLFTKECAFTDDSVLTCAVANSLITNTSLLENFIEFFEIYPNRGYGGRFRYWATSGDTRPYHSFGNGSAMRVSPVGWAFSTLVETLQKAKESAEVSHNHSEGIKGAQSTAAAIYLIRSGKSKDYVKEFIEETYSYDLSRTLDEIRPIYNFDETCQGSVPESIICFLESESYEECIRLAVSLGGDTDTQAAIAGSIAEAAYGIPEDIRKKGIEYLDPFLKGIVDKFYATFIH